MLILKNIALLYTGGPEPQELHNVHLFLNDGKIMEIVDDQSRELPPDADVVNCSSMVIMPGMINMHHHFFQTLTRNLPGAQQAELFDWLVYLYPIWANISLEAIESAASIACAELLMSGCTTSVDHFYLYPHNQNHLFDKELEVAKKMGMRMAICRGSMCLSKKDGGLPPDEVTQTTETVLAHSEEVIDTYHDGSEGSMVQVILAPCAPFSVTNELMTETKKIADRKGVLCHTHLAETRDEDDYCRDHYGCRPMELLESLGWLDDRTFLAHMVWLNEQEIETVAQRGTGIAHCPTSNMRLGSGIAPIFPLHKAGARIGIAVDGSASNDSSNMINEARQTLLLQRVKYGASALSARNILQMATWGGAEILHRRELGHIAPGKSADVIGFSMDRLSFAGGLSDPLAALIFCHVEKVDLSIVNGVIRIREGNFVDIDLEFLIDRHNKVAADLLKKRFG